MTFDAGIKIAIGIMSVDDTNSGARDVQIALLRKAGVAGRFSLLCSMSETVIQWSRRAIAKANPTLSKSEIDLKFLATHHGQDLADKVRSYLMARKL